MGELPTARDRSDKSRGKPRLGDLGQSISKRQARAAVHQSVSLILDPKTSEDDRSSAACALHSLAHLAVDSLGQIARKYPAVLRPIAEKSVVWPAFISAHGDFEKANRELIKRLNVGAHHFFRFTFPSGKPGKRWSMRTPANAYAVEMLKALFVLQCTCRSLDRDRRDKQLQKVLRRNGIETSDPTFLTPKLFKQILTLKPICRATVQQWFDAAWKVVLDQTDGHPEKDPQMRQLGVHRKEHTGTSKSGSKTSESNIRDGIKQRLQVAFSEVVTPGM